MGSSGLILTLKLPGQNKSQENVCIVIVYVQCCVLVFKILSSVLYSLVIEPFAQTVHKCNTLFFPFSAECRGGGRGCGGWQVDWEGGRDRTGWDWTHTPMVSPGCLG